MTKASVKPGLEKIQQKLDKLNESMNSLKDELKNSLKNSSNLNEACGCDEAESQEKPDAQKDDDVVEGNKKNEKTS